MRLDMTLAIWFWVLYVLSILGYCYINQPSPFRSWGGSLIFFILIGLLGWKVFGGPVQ